MKYSLEVLSNEKFLINFAFDIILSIKISLKKFWYLFVLVNIIALFGAHYHYSLQSKVYSISSSLKLGAILTPGFGSGVIQLSSTKPRFRDRIIENFGANKKDFMKLVQKHLGHAGFWHKSTGKSFNHISSFGLSRGSVYISVNGEGTNREKLLEKFNKCPIP